MGGDGSIIEPLSCESIERKRRVFKLLNGEGVTPWRNSAGIP